MLSSVKKKIQLAMFKTAFPISQFNNETSITEEHGQIVGMQLLYLRIPKDVKINTGKNLSIEYVEPSKN